MPVICKRNIPRFLILLFLTAITGINKAQIHGLNIDSLRFLAKKCESDTGCVTLTYQLGRALYHSNDIDGAIVQLQKSIRLAGETRYFAYASDARIILANAYVTLERYDSAFSLLKSAVDVALKLKQKDNIANINGNYAYLYGMLGDTKKSLEYSFKAIEGFDKSSDTEVNMLSVYSWIEIGKIFETQKQYDKAEFYFRKSLEKGKTNKHLFYMLPGLLNLGRINFLQGHPQLAEEFYSKVYNMKIKGGGVIYTMWSLIGLGDVDISGKDYEKAIHHFKQALQITKDYNLKINADDCLCNIGRAYLLNGQYDSSEAFLKKALRAATASGGWNTITNSYRYLSELYEKKGSYTEALYYNRLHKDMSDSIYNKAKVAALNNLEVLYQTNQKEKEIIRLQANNAEKELLLVKRSLLLWIAGISIVALVIIFFIYLRNNKYNQMIARQRGQLQEQKISGLEQEQKVIALKSMLMGQEAERTRIARDLHDGLSGLFSTIKMHLSTLQHEDAYLKEKELFLKSYKLIDTASEDLRHIAHNMMPAVLQKLGLVQALKDLCDTINTNDTFRISLLFYGMEERLPGHVETILYRIMQELLNNILKHAKATEVIVQFNRTGGHLDITVEDNGCGFSNVSEDKPHAGLDIIKDRVNYLNGNISIDSAQGIGTTVMISFNLKNVVNV